MLAPFSLTAFQRAMPVHRAGWPAPWPRSTIAEPGTFGHEFGEPQPSLAGMTCHGIFPPPAIRVRPKEGTDNEANDTNRRADHRDLAGA
jgi:hypothetical protein